MNLNVRLIVELSCVVPSEEVQIFEHLFDCKPAKSQRTLDKRLNAD